MFRIDTIYVLNITTEKNSEKKWMYGSCPLIKFYICTKFGENNLDGFKATEWTPFSN